MLDWLIKIANVLHPSLYEYWHKSLLEQELITVDETTLQVIEDDNIKSYMWVYCSGADTPAGSVFLTCGLEIAKNMRIKNFFPNVAMLMRKNY